MIDINDLLETKEKNETLVSHFKTLKTNLGWVLLVQIIEANIKILEDQILNGVEDETKEQIDRKRDKLKAYREVISTPDYWIKKLSANPEYIEDTDPYDTTDSLQTRRESSQRS